MVTSAEQIDGNMPARRGVWECLQFLSTVQRELRRGKYDLIHANYRLAAPYTITHFCLPIVLTLWGSDVVGVNILMARAFAWRADVVTVRSEEMQKLLGQED